MLGPNYARPETPERGAWYEPLGPGLAAAPLDRAQLATWWSRLDDPVLTELVARAVTGNLDVREARERVREANAHRDLARAALYPMVRGKLTLSPAEPPRGSSNQATGLEAVWNPDFFGGLRRGVEAALGDLGASQEALRDVLVGVAAEVAQSYVDVRSFQARLAIAEQNLDAQTETLEIASWRAQAGLTSALDVEQARSNAEQTRAQIPSLRAGLEEARNRLAVLVGETPGTLAEPLAEAKPFPTVATDVAVGVPAEALQQRPDVRHAERQLAAETARIGVASAEAYPSFSLTGLIGTKAISLAGPEGITAAAAANVVEVLFDHGAIRAKIRAQKAVREESLARFQSTVLHALEDVEDRITAYREDQDRRQGLAAAEASAERAARFLRERYASGLVDFLAVLDANRSLFSLQDQLAVSQGQVVSDLIRIYRSLGGGWGAGEI